MTFTPEHRLHPRRHACELAGWCAAERGEGLADNPHTDDDGRAWWQAGWHRYRAEVAA